MTMFCYKRIAKTKRVGEELKETRMRLGLDLEGVSRISFIAKNHLLMIEDCEYFRLPQAAAYRLAYIKGYAKAVGLDPKALAKDFKCEGGLRDIKTIHPHQSIRNSRFNFFSLTLRYVVAGVFIFIFVGYLAWQIKGVIEPPKLVLYSPEEGLVANTLTALIQGETEKETALTINGQEVRVNDSGRFETHLDLQNGVNTIIVSVKKKHGKTSSVTRHVVARPMAVAGEKVTLLPN
jgi:hypothetical protein